jgi:hypothetical protein
LKEALRRESLEDLADLPFRTINAGCDPAGIPGFPAIFAKDQQRFEL